MFARQYASRYDFSVPNPCVTTRIAQSCRMRPACGCHATTAPTEALVHRHDAEVARRVAWCASEGLEASWGNLFQAPGDDTQFVYGVKPWTACGSIDPRGHYSLGISAHDKDVSRVQKGLWHEDAWVCGMCATPLGRRARSYEGEGEPFWWRWCDKCRLEYRDKGKQALPANAQRVDAFFVRGRACEETAGESGYVLMYITVHTSSQHELGA